MSEEQNTPARKTFVQRLVSIKPSDLIALFFLCVLAGLVLAVFQVDPRELWVDFFATVGEAWREFFRIIFDSLDWAIQYFFLGAVLVIPIWIVWRVLKAMRRNTD